MMNRYMSFLLFSVMLLLSMGSIAQTTLKGVVYDAISKETLIGAAVVIEGTTIGITTDIDGKFVLQTTRSLPLKLTVSFLGYKTRPINVTSANASNLSISLEGDAVMMSAVEVKAQRISDKQKQSALTVEQMDALAIKEAASGSFYESLGNLKEVDVTSASLGFKVINTRGFNSTSPVRSLQLIDGVDNQSPGLNFSLGNFLGASDLDVRLVEVVAGASSAYFGPGAFNGVINMTTKDPYDFPGVSVEIKAGERALFQRVVRLADFTTNKDGKKKLGYKVNVFFMQAHDWEAEDYRAIEGARYGEDHPFGYDAVNIYGDEPTAVNNDNSDNLYARPGLTEFFRNGYKEKDLLNYNTNNTKLGAGLYYRIKDDVTINYGLNYSTGSTIYQGDNRYALKDVQFYQNKLEIGKKDTWFIRAYRTAEDAGKTYDVVTTAIRMQEAQGTTATWNTRFLTSWSQNIIPNNPEITEAKNSIFSFVQSEIAAGNIPSSEGLSSYNQLMETWINDNADFLNTLYQENMNLVNGQSGAQLEAFYEPGTARFDSLRADVTRRNFTENGSRFYDKSALSHIQGEYKWKIEGLTITAGGNMRWYRPDSRGTIFSDTLAYTYEAFEGERVAVDSSRVVIKNQEFGIYVGARKEFMEQKLIGTATLRMDKNQNFDYLFSPAASLVYSPSDKNTYRMSLSSAIRNPTLADQYLYYNVGRAILLGNVEGRFEAGSDSLFTIDSFNNYRGELNTDTLEYFNVDAIRPEQVKTFELGYRGKLTESLYIDFGGYYSRYKDFIGFNIGINGEFGPEGFPDQGGLQVYRVAANATSIVTTRGASIGLNYYFSKLSLNGNYSFNELVSGEEDPIIPAFNTPKNKFNLGIGGREITLFKKVPHFGFGINYKYIQGFLFEGSPQFTGSIPTYDMMDAQVNIYITKLKSTFKFGGSNIMGIRPLFDKGVENKLASAFDNKNFQVYGGPQIGRLLYASILIDLK
jgi:iron complex outermembrane recepter protein